jgi:nucleoside-diphosphate-sugar epimerase
MIHHNVTSESRGQTLNFVRTTKFLSVPYARCGILADERVEEITGETYGPLKALCEQAAEAAMPGRVLHVRPGLIVGPHDPTDRFTYWVGVWLRAARCWRPAGRSAASS